MPWAWLIAVLLLNPAVGLASFPWLARARGTARFAGWAILTIPAACLPALVPRAAIPLPFLASIATIVGLVKLYDIFRSPDISRPQSVAAYLVDFANGTWLVRRFPPEPVAWSEDVLRLIRNLLATGALFTATWFVFQVDWRLYSVVLEHVVKTPLVVLMVAAGVNAGTAAWRLAGGQGVSPMGNIAMAATPAEFWIRWNRPTQQFLLHYVFMPSGGRRHPVRAIMTTFLVSGLIHEYVFAIAGARNFGLQLLFFLIQGLGVVASRRLHVLVRSRAVSTVLTLVFNIATAGLFFASANEVVPFYAAR
jgi:hypothetical protein